MTVPTELIQESLKLEPTGADMVLVDFALNETETIYISQNNAALTFSSNSYTPFPFEISGHEESHDGDPSEITLTVYNHRGIFTDWMDENGGLTDRTLTIWFGNTTYIADASKWWAMTLYVTGASENRDAASFTLSASPLFDVSVPPDRFDRNCQKAYRSTGMNGCNYTQQAANIIGATNASPIVIETSATFNIKDGATGVVNSVGGNTAANGIWPLVKVDGTHYSLTGSTGNGAYTSGGTVVVSLPSCDFSLFGPNGCAAHDNTLNFGGEVAIPREQ